MSKIPQGDWNAIAARYAHGETISQIARSYDCTPPAIHYVLKRYGQRATDTGAKPAASRPEMPSVAMPEKAPPTAAAVSSSPNAPQRGEHSRAVQWSTGERHAVPRLRQHDLVRRHARLALRHVRNVYLDARSTARSHLGR